MPKDVSVGLDGRRLDVSAEVREVIESAFHELVRQVKDRITRVDGRCADLEAEVHRLRGVVAEVDRRVIVLEGPTVLDQVEADVDRMVSRDWIV